MTMATLGALVAVAALFAAAVVMVAREFGSRETHRADEQPYASERGIW